METCSAAHQPPCRIPSAEPVWNKEGGVAARSSAAITGFGAGGECSQLRAEDTESGSAQVVAGRVKEVGSVLAGGTVLGSPPEV